MLGHICSTEKGRPRVAIVARSVTQPRHHRLLQSPSGERFGFERRGRRRHRCGYPFIGQNASSKARRPAQSPERQLMVFAETGSDPRVVICSGSPCHSERERGVWGMGGKPPVEMTDNEVASAAFGQDDQRGGPHPSDSLAVNIRWIPSSSIMLQGVAPLPKSRADDRLSRKSCR